MSTHVDYFASDLLQYIVNTTNKEIHLWRNWTITTMTRNGNKLHLIVCNTLNRCESKHLLDPDIPLREVSWYILDRVREIDPEANTAWSDILADLITFVLQNDPKEEQK